MVFNNSNYRIQATNGVEGLKKLKNNSVKLIYGSPPYPNATRDYGVWKSDE